MSKDPLMEIPVGWVRLDDPAVRIDDDDLIWNYTQECWMRRAEFENRAAIRANPSVRGAGARVTIRKMQFDVSGKPLKPLPTGYVRITDPEEPVRDDDLIWDYFGRQWRKNRDFRFPLVVGEIVGNMSVARLRGSPSSMPPSSMPLPSTYGHW